MEKREMFEGKTSTNDKNHDQNDQARQSGDNDTDRKMPHDENADRASSDAYFDTNKKDAAEKKQSSDDGGLKEQDESLKNSF